MLACVAPAGVADFQASEQISWFCRHGRDDHVRRDRDGHGRHGAPEHSRSARDDVRGQKRSHHDDRHGSEVRSKLLCMSSLARLMDLLCVLANDQSMTGGQVHLI